MPRKRGIPSYRKRIIDGREIAVVTLLDWKTGRRRYHRLGAYGSPASREKYVRLLTAWEAAGHGFTAETAIQQPTYGLTVSQVAWSFLQSIEGRYSQSEPQCFKAVIRVLRGLYGETPAASFGPNALRLLRHAMVKGDERADPPRPPWSRVTVNKQTHRVRAIFRWAVSLYSDVGRSSPNWFSPNLR